MTIQYTVSYYVDYCDSDKRQSFANLFMFTSVSLVPGIRQCSVSTSYQIIDVWVRLEINMFFDFWNRWTGFFFIRA